MIRLSDISKNRRGEIVSIRKKNANDTWQWLENVGLIIDNEIHNGNYDGVKDFWKDEPCFIIGAGPSLKGFDFNELRGKHTIGINHVIEDYDEFEWFLFLDKRFLTKTTYDLKNYKGRIFASNMTGLVPSEDVTIFKANNEAPTENIEDGLYGPYLSALCALNLAIIAGANPIYLIGVDCGGGTPDDYHYKTDYKGIAENKEKQREIHKKYCGTAKYFTKFKKYKDRVINLSKHSNIEIFQKKPYSPREIKIINNRVRLKTGPKIAHMSFSNDINVHADITRGIFNEGYGSHSIHTFDNVPNADLYFYEGFISTRDHIMNWPFKEKSIFIVHSVNVIPVGNWKCIVALTNAWKNYLISKGIESKKIVVINGGIDLEQYKNCDPDYKSQNFGRITRISPGKWPKEMNQVIFDLLTEFDKSKCILWYDRNNKAELLVHPRFIKDTTVKINHFKGDALKKLSVYFHVNNTFRDTLSFACIEALATGLPIVYKHEDAIKEVVGDAGISCNSYEAVKNEIRELLLDKSKRIELGEKAKCRAQRYNLKEKISQFDSIVRQVINA